MPTSAALLVPTTRPEMRQWIQADLAAHGLEEWRCRYRTTHPLVHWQVLRRHAEYWRYGTDHHHESTRMVKAKVLAARVHALARELCLDIPLGTTGPGLLVKGPGVRVHPAARIGAYAVLHPGVIVAEDNVRNGRVPMVGEYCEIGTNSVVCGADLGNRVEVAAGAVVDTDVDDDGRIGGVPAQLCEVAASTRPRRDGRRTRITDEQLRLAHRLNAAGRMTHDAIADAFWVDRRALEARLREVGVGREAPPHAS